MALESFFNESAVGDDLYEEESSTKNWKKSISTNVMGSDYNSSPGFDCNICLDFVQDPVVTLCGHLYCWPCIYKWLNLQNASTEYSDPTQPQCPVCKATISEATLVPLYGRGKTTDVSEEKSSNLNLVIPPRPPAPLSWHLIPASPAHHQAQQFHHLDRVGQPRLHHHNVLTQAPPYYLQPDPYGPSPTLNLGGFSTSSNSVHPVVGMFGEMVYERMFGNSMANIYDYRNPYIRENSSPRMRRQVMQADKSLSRICFFLFCCIFLCLLLF